MIRKSFHCVQVTGERDINCPAKVLALRSSVWDSLFQELVNDAPGDLVPCPTTGPHEPLLLLLRCMLGLTHVDMLPPAMLPAILRCEDLSTLSGVQFS